MSPFWLSLFSSRISDCCTLCSAPVLLFLLCCHFCVWCDLIRYHLRELSLCGIFLFWIVLSIGLNKFYFLQRHKQFWVVFLFLSRPHSSWSCVIYFLWLSIRHLTTSHYTNRSSRELYTTTLATTTTTNYFTVPPAACRASLGRRTTRRLLTHPTAVAVAAVPLTQPERLAERPPLSRRRRQRAVAEAPLDPSRRRRSTRLRISSFSRWIMLPIPNSLVSIIF